MPDLVAPAQTPVSRPFVLYAWSGCMVGGSLLLVLIPSATLVAVGCFIAAAALIQVSGAGKALPPAQRAAAFLGVPVLVVIGIWQVVQGSSACPRWLSVPCLVLTLLAALVFWRRPSLLTTQNRAA